MRIAFNRLFAAACLSLAVIFFSSLYSSAYSADTDSILGWLPPGTVEIRCVNGPVVAGKNDNPKPLNVNALSFLDFLQGTACGDLCEFLDCDKSQSRDFLAGKTVVTAVRGSQVINMEETGPNGAPLAVRAPKCDFWQYVDIIEFSEPINDELTADLLALSLKHSNFGASLVWEKPSKKYVRSMKLYLTVPDDHTVILSRSVSPSLLLAAVQRKNVHASNCVIPSNHIGWGYLDRQSDFWLFNAYPAAYKLQSWSSQPQGLDEFARSGYAVVAQYRRAKSSNVHFTYISNNPNAFALLKARLDNNFVTPRMRFNSRGNKIVPFEYTPIGNGPHDYYIVSAALYSMVLHEVH